MLTSKQIDQLSKAGIRIIDSMRAIGYKKKPEGDEPDPEVGLRHFRGVLANFIMYLLDGGEAENYVPVYSEMDKRIIEAIGRRPEITEELSID